MGKAGASWESFWGEVGEGEEKRAKMCFSVNKEWRTAALDALMGKTPGRSEV